MTQISWTNNLLILSGTKSIEEKEFYLKLCIQENYSKRELERQLAVVIMSATSYLREKHYRKQ